MPDAAVITADIVNSTQLTGVQEKKLFAKLETLLATYKYEFYRGDSFQVYLKQPADALKLLLRLRTQAKELGNEFDIRAAIGIGTVAIPVKKLGVAAGEAFVLSGRALDETGKRDDQQLVIRTADIKMSPALEVIALFIDYIFRGMTGKQARVLALLLDGETQTTAARKIRKSQSTVNKHVQSAGWQEITKLLSVYEGLFSAQASGKEL